MSDDTKTIRIKEADKRYGVHFWLIVIAALMIIIFGWFITIRKVVVNDIKNVGEEIKYSTSSIKSDISAVKKTIKPIKANTTQLKGLFDNMIGVFEFTNNSHDLIIKKVKDKIETEEKNKVQYAEEKTTKQ